MILPKFIQEIIEKIESAGFEAFVVGGCVRDLLLGNVPNDWDITTSAPPDIILNIFAENPLITSGIKHGTVGVVIKNSVVEITTYRVDGKYLDSRHPETVYFTKNIADDLSRRDFTINAMAYNFQSGLIDLFDGKTDLGKKTIRCVGNPILRFKEDSLRIMRALRFAATLGFEIEPSTNSAIHTEKAGLNSIAHERISTEFVKLLMAENPSGILIEYSDIIGTALGFNAEINLDKWRENSNIVDRAKKNLPLRLALLFDGFEIDKALSNLRLNNKTARTTQLLYGHLNQPLLQDVIFIKKLLSQIGPDLFSLILEAKFAKFPDKASKLSRIASTFESIVNQGECFSVKQLAVSGNDLLESGLNGKEIKAALNLLLDAVIEEKCKNSKEKLLKYIQKTNSF